MATKMATSMLSAADEAENEQCSGNEPFVHRYKYQDIMVVRPVKEFEDAKESFSEIEPFSGSLDLDSCIQEANVALGLFFNNRFNQAKERMLPWIDRSMYHALGNGTISFIQAVMTFDMADIESAIEAIKRSIGTCQKFRKKNSVIASLSKLAMKENYDDYTEDELHAELCYAESLLIRAMLTFIQDENLISFVKGGLKIRECYKLYNALILHQVLMQSTYCNTSTAVFTKTHCNRILKHRSQAIDKHAVHFQTGVNMGIGTFNLMISLLPSKVMKLLEFVGFSGNKHMGLDQLLKGTEGQGGLRSKLCAIILVAYHCLVTYVLGLGNGDIELASRVLQPCLKDHPNGALFLFLSGRLKEVKGNTDEAVREFEGSIDAQNEWKQFHHLCYWELMWCHCFKADWLMAMKYAERLCHESRWSKATYTYQKAAFLSMCSDQSEDSQKHLDFLFGEVPRLKQRIAGKSIPFEKFAVAKSQQYFQQGNKLILPAIELIYVWNGFNIVGKNRGLLDTILSTVETALNEISQSKDENWKYYYDNYSLALLLKGVCLRCRDQHFQAEQCFLEVIENEKKIVSDHYLIPFAIVECAILYLYQDRVEETKKFMEKAKKNYKGYYLENRLHFRLHAMKLQLSSTTNNADENNSNSFEDEDIFLNSEVGSIGEEDSLDGTMRNTEDEMTQL